MTKIIREDETRNEIKKIEEQIKLMKNYLLHKIDIEDWHGGYDSCIDIRCLAEKLQWLKENDNA